MECRGKGIVIAFLLFSGLLNASPDTTRIGVIADIHFLSRSIASEGEALAGFEQASGRNVAELHEVLDKVLADLVAEKIEVLLVCGDLTNHGERRSHLDLKEKLLPLLGKGMRIFVVPGNHDVNIPDAKEYTDSKAYPTESIAKEEFAEIYARFGYADALSHDDASLSYLAALDDTTWLLCLDTNRYDEHRTTSITGGRVRPETMEWATNLLNEARKRGVTVLGMMHHGLVEHMPYQSAFFSDYLVEEWERCADRLADEGVKVVFTGHFHSNDVSCRTSSRGNVIHDVETASLAQYPFAYRIMKLSDGCLSMDTRFVTSIPGNPNLEAEYRTKRETLARRVATSRLKQVGMPMPEETQGVLVDLIVRLSLMHARGDEQPDEAMMEAVRTFAGLLGDEAVWDDEMKLDDETGVGSFVFDFPPEDNRLVIDLN